MYIPFHIYMSMLSIGICLHFPECLVCNMFLNKFSKGFTILKFVCFYFQYMAVMDKSTDSKRK